jgi:alkanesulfonate monooxygenase SsuD/methylene tetrahydromethanopterin reductase-like flavin-dependent oxidoreductase (luciferase family)
MSGGRVEVGLGAGWNEEEHRQLGLPFPEIKERADLLEEQLTILHGLWGEPDGWSYSGPSATIESARFHPKPVQVPGRPVMPSGIARPRILLGGGGSPRSLRLAARWADEFNTSSAGPAKVAEVYAALDAACVAIGRDPATMARSAMVGVLVGRDANEVRTREAELLAAFGQEDAGDEWLGERRDRWVFGTPDEARAMIHRFAEVGVERIMLQDFLPRDLEMIDVMGETLLGQV